MRAQRSADAAPCVAARAEALPFVDDEFDVAMSVMSDHHWADPIGGLREMRRVARRVVVFQWDSRRLGDFWLVRDYLPEFLTTWARPTLAQRAAAIGADMQAVPIPWDCEDGFFHSYWRRPEAYLQPAVRQGTSVWSVLGGEVECRRRGTAKRPCIRCVAGPQPRALDARGGRAWCAPPHRLTDRRPVRRQASSISMAAGSGPKRHVSAVRWGARLSERTSTSRQTGQPPATSFGPSAPSSRPSRSSTITRSPRSTSRSRAAHGELLQLRRQLWHSSAPRASPSA